MKTYNVFNMYIMNEYNIYIYIITFVYIQAIPAKSHNPAELEHHSAFCIWDLKIRRLNSPATPFFEIGHRKDFLQ